jgi:hypothetical protein
LVNKSTPATTISVTISGQFMTATRIAWSVK